MVLGFGALLVAETIRPEAVTATLPVALAEPAEDPLSTLTEALALVAEERRVRTDKLAIVESDQSANNSAFLTSRTSMFAQEVPLSIPTALVGGELIGEVPGRFEITSGPVF